MLDSWNFSIGVVSLKTVKPVKLVIYLQTLKTYLDLKTSTNNVTRKAIPLHYRSGKKGIEIYVRSYSSLVKSTLVVMTIPSSSLGIIIVYSRVILTAASLASKLHHSNSLSILVTLAMGW